MADNSVMIDKIKAELKDEFKREKEQQFLELSNKINVNNSNFQIKQELSEDNKLCINTLKKHKEKEISLVKLFKNKKLN